MAKLICTALLAVLMTADSLLGQAEQKIVSTNQLGRTLYVRSGFCEGGLGTIKDPYIGLEWTLSISRSSDTIVLFPGVYHTKVINKRATLKATNEGPARLSSIQSVEKTKISIDPDKLVFDTSTEILWFTICNPDGEGKPVSIRKISTTLPSGSPFSIGEEYCYGTLNPGYACNTAIKCDFTENTVQALVRIESDAPGSPHFVQLVSNRIKPPPPPPPYESTWICYNSPIPSGWIKVTDEWDPSRCGNPSFPGVYNIWIIARYDNQAVGTIMNVCAGQRIPPGWILIDTYKDMFSCGHPDGFSTLKNVQKIRRVE